MRYFNMAILNVCMHVIKFSCVYLVLSLIIACAIGNRQSLNHDDSNNIVLTLETQDQLQDVSKYRCHVKQSQIKDSNFLNDLIAQEFDAKIHTDGAEHSNMEVPLPCDGDFQFVRFGFNDICYYFQNVHFYYDYDDHDDEYQLPIPLFLDDLNDFYNDVIIKQQLTHQEIEFMKQLESFDIINPDPFDIGMTKTNILFKFADYLQIKRLCTIIAARQASLMMNMSKQQMIEWLFDDPREDVKKPLIIHNNNQSNDNHAKMVPLLPQTQTSSNNAECSQNQNGLTINEIKKYDSGLLMHILAFFSCFDIRTFSTISNEFYDFVDELKSIQSNIDPTIKVLTNNNDATCLSLTNQELLFYQPFLTLPQSKWSKDQNTLFNTLKTMQMTDNIVNVDDEKLKFGFDTLTFFNTSYNLHELEFSINNTDHSIRINIHQENYEHFSNISFNFGNFVEQVNMIAQSRDVEHIKVFMSNFRELTSFGHLIGINRIKNIKTIDISKHSFTFIDFEAIHDISDQLEHLQITETYFDAMPSVKNVQFLSKMKSLKELYLTSIELDSFDLDELKGLTHLEILQIYHNKINTQCVDFALLSHLTNLKILDFESNRIQCIINFESIQHNSQLESLILHGNQLLSSWIDFSQFDESKPLMNRLQWICLSDMSLKYTMENNKCLDLQFLKFMPNIKNIDFSSNKIECVDNISILQRGGIQLDRLALGDNNLISFDFADLIGSNIIEIDLRWNDLSFESVKNFDKDTLSKINPGDEVVIYITTGNDNRFQRINAGSAPVTIF